jgi:hypothetical protein
MRRINLNNYAKVGSAEEAGDKGICVIPFRVEGVEQAPIFFKPLVEKSKREVTQSTMSATEWNSGIIIDDRGTPDEYSDLVRWWFSNASKEYVDRLKAQFKIQNFEAEVMRAKSWLLDVSAYEITGNGRWSKRKKNIDRFLKTWLNRAYTIMVRRSR